MNRTISLLLLAGVLSACGGPYRVTYQMPSRADEPYSRETTTHAHGIGPLLIGGGGFFGLLNPMSPALFDWTGAEDVGPICQHGFSEVSHRHRYTQNVMAGFISWLTIFNSYHESDVDWKCLRAPAKDR